MIARIQMITTAPQDSFVCFAKRAHGYPYKWHFHPEYELTWIVRSHGQQFVGDAVVNYSDGELVLIGPNLPHTWRSTQLTGRHEAVVLQFRGDCLGETFFNLPEMRRVRLLLEQSRRGLQFRGPQRRAVGDLMRALLKATGPDRVRLLVEVLERLTRVPHGPLASAAYQPVATRDDERRIARICDYVQSHAEEKLTQDGVARLMHMSPSSLSRFFRRTTGRTFTRYLTELRIGLVCRRLIETNQTVAEICFDCGFQNLANFNRRFRQLKGVTPTQYRRLHNETVKHVPVVEQNRQDTPVMVR